MLRVIISRKVEAILPKSINRTENTGEFPKRLIFRRLVSYHPHQRIIVAKCRHPKYVWWKMNLNSNNHPKYHFVGSYTHFKVFGIFGNLIEEFLYEKLPTT